MPYERTQTKTKYLWKGILFLLALSLSILSIYFLPKEKFVRNVEAVNVLTNPSFTGGLTGWDLGGEVQGFPVYDSSIYQNSIGSVRSTVAANEWGAGYLSQSLTTVIIPNSTTTLSFYWRSTYSGFCGAGQDRNISVILTGPNGEVRVGDIKITTNTTTWYLFSANISSLIASYSMDTIIVKMGQTNTCSGSSNIWLDNFILDTTPPPNTAPTAPTSLLTNGLTNPINITANPYFSAIFNDPDSGNTGNYYQIQVNTENTFTGTTMWDSGQVSMTPTAVGSRSPNINYNGTALSFANKTFYWRIRFWDNNGAVSPYSATAQFTTNTVPTAPTDLRVNGIAGLPVITTTTPYFSAIFNDDGNSGIYYQIQVNTNNTFTGTSMWDSGQTSMTTTAPGIRSPNITYNGTALTLNGASYYWRIRFWDESGSASPYSAVAQFTMASPPTFTAFTNNGPVNPGDTITFSATATFPPSSNGINFLVCKTPGSYWSGCDGGIEDTFCSIGGDAVNPSCTFTVPIPNPDGNINVYPYVFDEDTELPASGSLQGSTQSFTVNNVAPVITNTSINGGSAITLTENGTKSVSITTTVTDNNGCSNPEISSVLGYLYPTPTSSYTNCDTAAEANGVSCYPEITCNQVGATCTGSTDSSADYTCTTNLQYYSLGTDTTAKNATDTWKTTIKATDNNSSVTATEISTGVEVNSLLGYNITPSINYGNLLVGQSNNPLNKTTTITNLGNTGLTHTTLGTNMCANYPTCTGAQIAVGNQRYALNATTPYTSGAVLGTTASNVATNIRPTTDTQAYPVNIWWGIRIPDGTATGQYDGLNTLNGNVWNGW